MFTWSVPRAGNRWRLGADLAPELIEPQRELLAAEPTVADFEAQLPRVDETVALLSTDLGRGVGRCLIGVTRLGPRVPSFATLSQPDDGARKGSCSFATAELEEGVAIVASLAGSSKFDITLRNRPRPEAVMLERTLHLAAESW